MKNTLEPSIELKQIDPRTRYFDALGGAFLALLPLIPLWIVCVKFDWPLWYLLIYAVLALVLAVRHANAAYARFGYALLDDGLWLQSGVFWRKAVFVPRERVQHTEVNHGPLDRKMGLAKLVLHTAGLRMQHLTIPGLPDAQAHALRDNLLKRALVTNLKATPEPSELHAAETVGQIDLPNISELAPILEAAAPAAPNETTIGPRLEPKVAALQLDLAPSQPPSQVV